jgi:hypothetical protein
MTPQAVKNVVEAMIDIAQEESAAGNYAEAIKKMTAVIEAVEHNDRTTRMAFGPHMVRMYCLRAKLLVESCKEGAVEPKIEMARRDIHKAETAFEDFYGGMEPTEKASLQTSIGNVIGDDEKLRADSLALVLQIGETIQPCAQGGRRVLVTGGRLTLQFTDFFANLGARAAAFLIGSVLWIIALGLLLALPRNSSDIATLIFGLPLFFVGYLGMQGWDWFSQYRSGTYGNFIKFLAFMFIAFTGIGMIFIAYWTGNCVLRWRARMQVNM